MTPTVLVRYGAVPEVARCRSLLPVLPERGQRVVVQTRRGVELGTVLEQVRSGDSLTAAQRALLDSFRTPASSNGEDAAEAVEPGAECVLRLASAADEEQQERQTRDAQQQFDTWVQRIRDWGLELELIDLEWTLDRAKLILYVLGGRGAETTKLALQAATAGVGAIEVQPLQTGD